MSREEDIMGRMRVAHVAGFTHLDVSKALDDLAYLLERNAELEATVRAVEELIEPYVTRDAISGSIDETRRVHVRVADLRAALNQGGETK